MRTSGTMVSLAQEYLAYRRSLGFQLRIEGSQLLNFARYADQRGHCGYPTTDLAIEWARLPHRASLLYQARRLEVVRCFARYCAVLEPCTEIPPKGLLGPAHRRTTPYIFTESQVGQLLAAARELPPSGGLRARTYATLFGLLACTGLRISEALKLRDDDVDLGQGLLRVAQTKFNKTRLVPLSGSARGALSDYAHNRDQLCGRASAGTFFVSPAGRALPYSTVRTVFRGLCRKLGWDDGSNRRPRMHDLRHTFACRRLLAWYREGVDVQHAIASLSTYLGHGKITDTYWYLSGVPELMAVAADRFARECEGRLP